MIARAATRFEDAALVVLAALVAFALVGGIRCAPAAEKASSTASP